MKWLILFIISVSSMATDLIPNRCYLNKKNVTQTFKVLKYHGNNIYRILFVDGSKALMYFESSNFFIEIDCAVIDEQL